MREKINNALTVIMFAVLTFGIAYASRYFGFDFTVYPPLVFLAVVAVSIYFFALTVSFILWIVSSSYKSDPVKVRRAGLKRKELSERDFSAFLFRVNLSRFFRKAYFVLLTASHDVLWLAFSSMLFTGVGVFFSSLIPVVLFVVPVCLFIFSLRGSESLPEIALLSDGSFPALVELSDQAKKEAGYRGKLSVYAQPDNSSYSWRTRGEICIGVGLLLLETMTEEELKALLVRNLIFETNRRVQKLMRAVDGLTVFDRDSKPDFFSFLFAPVNARSFVTGEVDEMLLTSEAERITDSVVSADPNKDAYVRSLKKCYLIQKYKQDERSDYLSFEYAFEGAASDYLGEFRLRFTAAYGKFGKQWEEEIRKEIPSVITSSPPYLSSLETIKSEDPAVSFDGPGIRDLPAIEGRYNRVYAEMLRNDDYGMTEYREMQGEITRFEQRPEQYVERNELILVARAYRGVGRLDNAEKIYRKLIESGDDSSELCFEYGSLLLSLRKDEGIGLLYRAMEDFNYTERGMDILSDYLKKTGNREELDKFRNEYLDEKLDMLRREFSAHNLSLKRKFTRSTFPEQDLKAVEEFVRKDDNVTALYCVDAKSEKGNVLHLFAFDVRNATEEAADESFRRIFSLLDNEFEKYDTYLVSLDRSPVFRKKIAKVKDAEVFRSQV